jgi:hypothetical protein
MRYPDYWFRVALVLMFLSAAPCAAGEGGPNEVVCTVNGEKIRRREVEDRMPTVIVNKLAGLRRRLTDMGRTEAEAQEAVDGLLLPVFRQTLRYVVRERLMLQEANRQGLRVNALLASETFEHEWAALKARELAGKPGYEEKTVRERTYQRLLLQTFRRKPEVSRDEDAWFRSVLKRSRIDGNDGQPVELTFFFPNDKKEPARP